MVPMVYDDDFGCKLVFFDDLEKYAVFKESPNPKNQRVAFFCAMHRRKLKYLKRFTISNECPPIWDQLRLSSSIRLEMTVQLRQQRWEVNAEKISGICEIK